MVSDFPGLSLEISLQLPFFPFLFSVYCCSVDTCVFSVVSGCCNQFFFPPFYVVFESSYLLRWRVLLLLFLIHIVCIVGLYHLWDVRPHATSRFFFFSCLFVEVLLSLTLKWPPTILCGVQCRNVSLCVNKSFIISVSPLAFFQSFSCFF